MKEIRMAGGEEIQKFSQILTNIQGSSDEIYETHLSPKYAFSQKVAFTLED